MEKLNKFLKGNKVRLALLAVMALIGITAAALGAATMAAFTSSLHAQRTIAAYDTEGERFSSNYLMRGDSKDHVRTVYTTNVLVSPSTNMTVCNYQQGKQTMPNADPITYTLTARLVRKDEGEADLYVPVDAAYMTAQSYTAYSVTITKGTTVTLNSSHLSDSSFGGTLAGGAPNSDTYAISFSTHFAANDPNLYLEIIVSPSSGTLPTLRGIIHPALRAEGASNHWTGSFNDDTNTAPGNYDGFNYRITGTGAGTVTLTWDGTKVALSDVALDELLAIEGASRVGNSVTFPVDSDMTTLYDLQFYKAAGSNFTGVTWVNMNSTIVQFSFS